MKCGDCKEKIVEYLEGALKGGKLRAFEEHIEACAGCRQELEEIKALDTQLQQEVPAFVENIQPSAAFMNRLKNMELEPHKPGIIETFVNLLQEQRVAFAGAFSVLIVIVVALSVMLIPSQDGEDDMVASAPAGAPMESMEEMDDDLSFGMATEGEAADSSQKSWPEETPQAFVPESTYEPTPDMTERPTPPPVPEPTYTKPPTDEDPTYDFGFTDGGGNIIAGIPTPDREPEWIVAGIEVTEVEDDADVPADTHETGIAIGGGLLVNESDSTSGTITYSMGMTSYREAGISIVITGTSVNGNTLIPPVTFKYEASIISENPIVYYEWIFGDGITEEALLQRDRWLLPKGEPLIMSIFHTYTQAGNFDADLRIIDETGGFSTTEEFGVTEFDFTAELVSCDNPLELKFTDTKNVSGSGKWEWDFDGNGVIDSTEQNPIYTYEKSGEYTVSLEVQGIACGIVKKSISISEPPAADFEVELTEEQGSMILSFMDVSVPEEDIVQQLWDFGDGNTSTQQNPTHTYDEIDAYEVSLKVWTDSGACNSVSKLIEPVVIPAPEPTMIVEAPGMYQAGQEALALAMQVALMGTANPQLMGMGNALSATFG